MNPISRIARLTAIALAAGAIAAPAFADDGPADAHIHIHGSSVAFLVGGSWGHGTMEFHGRTYKVKVRALKVGSIGASSYDETGDVFHLRHASDIDGTYASADASATAGAGQGAVRLTNPNGVVINLLSTSTGLQATLAAGGLEIELE
ncbi:MAG TPA: hypothetical protein VHW60_22960 [Caulobacteraceae bacterium]|jgi:hypothetical protein|nr:hypothetical protein [Caulobacteraceae bacterium]